MFEVADSCTYSPLPKKHVFLVLFPANTIYNTNHLWVRKVYGVQGYCPKKN